MDQPLTSSESTTESAAAGSSAQVEIQTAQVFTHPLTPDHLRLANPEFEEHWTHTLSSEEVDFLDGLDVESSMILSDYKKDYNDKVAMKATNDNHLKKRQDKEKERGATRDISLSLPLPLNPSSYLQIYLSIHACLIQLRTGV